MMSIPRLLCVVALTALCVTAQSAPPPLPYDFWHSFVVLTENWLTINGTGIEQTSVGFHAVVNQPAGVRCRHTIDDLFPVVQNYTSDEVANYTSGRRTTRQMNNDGTISNCTTEALSGAMQPGGTWFLAPIPSVLAAMVLLTNTTANGVPCDVWQWVGTDGNGNRRMIQWYVSTEGGVPQVLVNQTFYATPFNTNYTSRILTTAFNGYSNITDYPIQCVEPNDCGTEFCAANASAGSAAIESAIGWACNNGIDCTNISEGGPNYYPNTDLAHGTWVFENYFLQNEAQGAGACDFSGAALLTVCSTVCTMCNASATASDADLLKGISWVCNNGFIDCSPIQRGGEFYYPNTPQAHANFAYNVYYQGYKCVPQSGSPWCYFNNTAVVVSC